MNLDDHVCLCFRVSRRKLVNWTRHNSPKVPEPVSMCGGAGTGCGWCIPFLKQIFRQSAGASGGCQPPEPERALEVLTAEEYAAARADYVRAGHGTPPPGATRSRTPTRGRSSRLRHAQLPTDGAGRLIVRRAVPQAIEQILSLHDVVPAGTSRTSELAIRCR
jgi:bacterioferritin-associated ferredoxin